MIKSFACGNTEAIWEGRVSRRLPRDIQNRALRKMRQLDAPQTADDLRIPPSNHLENLKGDRKGWVSIRIKGPWRLCFRWSDGDALDVKIVDYH